MTLIEARLNGPGRPRRKPLADIVESALKKTRNQLQNEVLSRQVINVRPNIDTTNFQKLLGLLKVNGLIAVPADKNLGLCLVAMDWYHQAGLKLLHNKSYVEETPDHELLQYTYSEIQYKWLRQPIKEKWDKFPTLEVIPKIHKLAISARPIVPTFDTLLANASVWIDYQLKPLLSQFPWILPDSKTLCRI
ncbi:hypothetical protein BT96DRAFT_951000 [Gymnopus androsaceus JB14]|uniref:Uncharacterized protein n=1 Tax=Gymnopus androsaceus JB14 TaxID=1447944 RepID=A0A6A4GEG6_9AGAR|nr:hypothetical protein BT96DRAFT_951000 [Gymnopus androsaceus JB14]